MLSDVRRRGYDVLLLAQHGADPAIGLEISSDAVSLTLLNDNYNAYVSVSTLHFVQC